MKIKLLGVREPGNLEKERVVFRVCSDGDIGNIILLLSRKLDEKRVSSDVTNPFWLPDRSVRDGDTVVVYTKKGISSNKKNDDQSHSYFYYLGSGTALYGEADSCPVVIDIGDWDWTDKRI